MSRRLLGIAGPPGAGKSTYAAHLVATSAVPAAVVPMDGFHLADSTLIDLGLLATKGTPETFDPAGLAALLRRLHEEDGAVYAPGFDRTLEQPLAAALVVPPEVELVVVEGNYLLLDRPEWRAVRAQLDEVWYLDCPDDVRRERLLARHVEFGKTPAEAAAWLARVDDPDAVLVRAVRDRADRVVTPD
jgi:pantothenate kinase